MKEFFGVLKYEFGMATRRWGVMAIFGALGLFYLWAFMQPMPDDPVWSEMTNPELWKLAGQMAFSINVFVPVVAGIAIADRMARDVRLGFEELLRSTQLRRWPYVLGKYAGALLSVAFPALLINTLVSLGCVIRGCSPVMLVYSLPAFVLVTLPGLAFLSAFSLACPMIMPVRVYQVLFTGYWYWGNFLSPKVMPTLTETLLNAAGGYALEGFFSSGYIFLHEHLAHTAQEAVLNIAILLLCGAAALITLERYLAWKARRV